MLDRPAASQQEELKAQNVAALNWTETLFHLVSGSLVMVHAVLLPFRSAFTSIGWGAYTDRPALQYPELAGYCVSIYFVDVAFLVLHSTPLVRNQARRRVTQSPELTRSPSELNEHRLEAGEGNDDDEDTMCSRNLRLCLAILKVLRRLIAWVPVDLFVLLGNASLRTWTTVSLLRLLRLMHLPDALRAAYWFMRHKAGFTVGWARLSSYVPVYVLLLHLVACGWQAVGTWSGDTSGWQDVSPLAARPTGAPPPGGCRPRARCGCSPRLLGFDFSVASEYWLHYARAYYWACGTMTTVGLGDIVPTKWEEMVFTMAVMFISTFTASGAVGLLMAELMRSDTMKETWQARVERADAFIKKRKIPPHLARRLREYLQYQWLYLRGANESTFFAGLPSSLRLEVIFALNHKLLRSIPAFARSDADTIAALAELLSPVLFTKDEYLIKCSSIAEDGTAKMTPVMSTNAWLLVRGMVVESGLLDGNPNSVDVSQPSSRVRRPSVNSMSRFLRRSGGHLHPIRTYDEGSCILPAAATRAVEVCSDFRATTFVEVLALHSKDVERLTAARNSSNAPPPHTLSPATLDAAAPMHAPTRAPEAPMTVACKADTLPRVGPLHPSRRPSSVNNALHGIISKVTLARKAEAARKDGRVGWSVVLPSLWLALRLLAISYLALVLPVRVAFESRSGLELSWLAADIVTDLVLWLQLWSELYGTAVNLNQLRHQVMVQRKQSHRPMLKRRIWVAIDIVCCMPYEWVGYAWNPSQSWVPALMLPRLVRLRCAGSWMGEIVELMQEHRLWLEPPPKRIRCMTCMVIKFIVVCHWGACVWLWIGLIDSDSFSASDLSTQSWLMQDAVYLREASIANPDDQSNRLYSYLRSLYWMIVTVSTVGLGDIVSKTIAETWVASIFITFGALLYPAFTGAMVSLLVDAMAARAEHATVVRDFVHRNLIAEPLRSQIIMFSELGERIRTETQLLRSLPPSLHSLATAHLYLDIVRSVSCFCDSSEAFLVGVGASLRVELTVPNFFIAQTGDATTGIIFLERGEVHRRLHLASRACDVDAASAPPDVPLVSHEAELNEATQPASNPLSLTRLGSLVTDRSSRGLFDGLFISSNSNESPSARRRFEDDVDLAESFGGRSTNLSELITTPRVRVAGDTPSSPDDADPISDTILLEKVKDGGSIGAEEFVIGALHRCDMIAISLCECLVLRRKPFDELLSRFPELETTIKERALEWYLASCERDKAICRNLVKSPKLLKCMGAADVFGSSSIAEHRIHETALFIATNDTAEVGAARGRGLRLQHLLRTLDGWAAKLRSAHVWSLLLCLLLLYRLCGDPFRACLSNHFAVPSEWSAALQNGSSIYPLPNGADGCDPSTLAAQGSYSDSVGLCIFDFFVDVAIGVDLLGVQLHTLGGSAASKVEMVDEPTAAWHGSHGLLPFALLLLAVVLVLDALSIAVAGVRDGSDAVSDAMTTAVSIIWVLRLPLLVFLPHHTYNIEVWLLKQSPAMTMQHMRLGRLVLIVMMLSHLSACVWAYIGWREFDASFVTNTSAHTWQAYSWWARDVVVLEGAARCQPLALLAWLRGLYISIGTFVVVPIGDMVPDTMPETYYMIFLIIAGSTLSSTGLGVIVNAIARLDQEEYEHAVVQTNMEKVLMSHGVPPPLQQRVVRFLVWSHYRGADKDKAVLNKLPPQLQLETSKAIRLELLSKTKLADLLPRAVLGHITNEMRGIVITPSELLMLEGDQGAQDMYIIVEGVFEVLTAGRRPSLSAPVHRRRKAEALMGEKMGFTKDHFEHTKSTVVGTVGPGAVLGEVSFFLQGTARNATVRAVTRAVVLQLTRTQLDAACALFGLHRDAAYLAKLESLVRSIDACYRSTNERIVREQAIRHSDNTPGLAVHASTRHAAPCKMSEASKRSSSAGNVPIQQPSSYRYVFPPSTLPRQLWELVMALTTAILATSIPFLIAVFGPRSPVSVANAWTALVLQWSIDVILLCDSLLRAYCFPFLPQGRETFMQSELTHAAIRTHYVQVKLRLDLLASLPYEALAPIGLAVTSDTKTILLAVALLRLPRLLRCSRILEHCRVAFALLPPQLHLSSGQARLAVVTCLWVYVCHAFACFWLFDAYTLPKSALGRNWMTEDIAWKDASWAHSNVGLSYLRAVHFTMSHMSTVGLGDVRPQNALETVFAMVLALVSALLFACLIGLISSLVRLNDGEEEMFKTQTDYLQHYTRHHQLPSDLVQRITAYYRLISSNPRVSHTHLTEALPPFLLRDIGLWMHRNNILSVPALSSLTFFPLIELCVALRPELFLEGDTVITKGDPAVKLYLVDLGKLRAGGRRLPNMFRQAPPRSSSSMARRKIADREASSTGMPALSSYLIGRNEGVHYVGAEMLAFSAPLAPVLSAMHVEATTHCHLFGLSLGVWKGLCSKFPDELGPISRGSPPACCGQMAHGARNLPRMDMAMARAGSGQSLEMPPDTSNTFGKLEGGQPRAVPVVPVEGEEKMEEIELMGSKMRPCSWSC